MRVVVTVALAIAALGVYAVATGTSTAADDAKKVELKVGDAAPEFESTDDQGETWKSSDHVGKKFLVIYFYPGDLTGGCTMQACGFRDDMEKLKEKGAEVVGVSGDSVDNHKLFKKVKKLNFTLLADEKGELAKKFGVTYKPGGKSKVKDAEGNDITLERGVTIQRWTFVIGKDGKVLYKDSKVEAAKDSKKILEVIEKESK
jgi:peroxiredoxin Q/BCP